ncbi:MAG TPA: LapA family protein, partial [Longimicrobiaceae bacterium]|nr:LapA family protein [Longimicrobiaceae bacterium]
RERGMSRGGWFGIAALALLAAGFAHLNRAETAALHLGVLSFVRVPVAILVLGAFLLGMVAMFLLGLRQDLRVRRMLRERPAPFRHEDDATELYPRSYSPHDVS